MAQVTPRFFGGSLLHWELVRAVRRRSLFLLRYGYMAFLLLQFAVLHANFQKQLTLERLGVEGLLKLEHKREEVLAWRRFANDYLATVLAQQFFLLVFITPLLTAGTLGQEKERGTLQALLGTQLSSSDIVLGKLLGRMALLGQIALVALPVMVLLAGVGEVSVSRLALAVITTTVVTGAMAAACMLCSIWMRQTRDAILACYASVIILFLGAELVFDGLPLWLDPREMQRRLLVRHESVPLELVAFMGGTAGATALCLGLAVAGLRHAGRVLEDRRPSRWLWAFRPPVAEDPVRWREQHVIGVAPLPWLRIIPGWLARLGVFTFSALLAVSSLDYIIGRGALMHTMNHGDMTALSDIILHLDPKRLQTEIDILGLVLVGIATVVVGVRSATSISEEQRRKTWDDLVLTPLTLEDIARQKTRGILLAMPPYLILYMLPMLALSSLGGMPAVMRAGLFLLIAVATVYIAAQVGLAISMRAGAEAVTGRPLHELQSIGAMARPIGHFTLVVRDYEEAIAYYTNVLGFELREQSVIFAVTGWLLVAPCGTRETRLLLVKPSTREQVRCLRDQTGGRVFPFLHTADIWGQYRTLQERGVHFRGEPHQVSHATVVAFDDRFGNKWDLVQWP